MRQYYCDNLSVIGKQGWLISYIENGQQHRKPYQIIKDQKTAKNLTNKLNQEELNKLNSIFYFKKGWF